MTSRASALAHFKKVDPRFYRATSLHHASLPLQLRSKRTNAALFESLVSIVVSQQLGLAAADAIFARVKTACGTRLTPKSVLKIKSRTLRKAGLSGAKIKTLKSVAQAVENKSLNLLALRTISESDASGKLNQIWGIGPWSAEMFMMFALGRPDVFSAGDLGLVRAMEAIYALPKNTPRETLTAIAEKWSPHRTYASLLLWRTRDKK
jgi:DNA-3-methyladenine glycosylase II